MSGAILVLSTVPDEAKGRAIGRTLVEERLAACVNVTAPVHSTYRWKDKIVEEAEWVLLIKTKESLYPALEARLRAIHPYEIPEIIALSVVRGSAPYLDWIAAETL